MNATLVTVGALLLVANIGGWVIGAATTASLGAVLSMAALLAFAGAWFLVAGGRRGPQRAPLEVRRRDD